ncbi:MAG: hypothetical protein HQL12_04235 [Candidatus Omnitrophica bacterium]|nr:hypothetical protein [Candidatus Omnitrophota bacterium]
MNTTFNFFSRLNRWLWVGLITIIVIWFAQQAFLKPVIESVAAKAIGAKVTFGNFSLNIFTHKIRITDLQVYNEQGFPPKVFFNASEILVDADLFEALKGKLHFPLVIFRLNKMIVFKNPQGKLNVNELKIVQEKLHEKTKGPLPNFIIDELKLNIEQVVVEDDSKTPPVIEAYDLNLKDKTIRNINGVPKLVGLLMFEALKPTALQGAGLYAATALLGVGFLPGLAIGIAVARDDAVSDMLYSSAQVYQHSLQLVKRLGQIKRTNDSAGQIFAKVYNCDISIEVQKQGWNRSKITIKARKYFLAKPEIAAGLLYQLKEELATSY